MLRSKSMRTPFAAQLLSEADPGAPSWLGRLGAAALAVGAFFAAGSASADPAIRKQLDIEGDFALIGSTMIYDCGNRNRDHVKVGEVAAGDNCLNFNANAPEAFWRADYPNDGSVEASTEFTSENARTVAVLELPEGAEIEFAQLYWAGYRSREISRDTGVQLERGSADSPQLLEVVLPDAVMSKPQPNAADRYYYQATADITGIVKRVGPGPFRVGKFESQLNEVPGTMQGGVASWHLVVFYELDGQPPRNLTLFDGLEYVDRVSESNFALEGFQVPDAGFEAQLAVMAYDGQAEFEGDSLRFNGKVLGNALNPTTNFFNASRSHLGRAVSVEGDLPRLSGEPGSYANVDFDVIDVTQLVKPGQTRADLVASAGTGNEVFLLGAFVTSISTLEPDFSRTLKTAEDVDGGLTLPGDTVEYVITMENSGTDAAVDARFVDELPEGVTFVPGSIRLGIGPDGRSVTDKAGDDIGEYDPESRTVTVRVGAGASATAGGTVKPGQTEVVSFRVTVDDDTRGKVINQGAVIAVGEKGAPETMTPTDGEPDTETPDPTEIDVNGCGSDADCKPPAPICDTSITPHECVACMTDSQCMGNEEPDCHPDMHMCHCPDGRGKCRDSDMDGVSDGTEEMNGTDPMDADSDDDGALDGEEFQPGEDTDGDGLINGLDPDSDDDGLFDGTELGKDCSHPDTDPDAHSCRVDEDPSTVTSPIKEDSDGGGAIDGSEDFDFDGEVDDDETDPLDALDDVVPGARVDVDDGPTADTDGDGLSDGFEATVHSDPEDVDSDDDGLLDGDEPNPSHDGDRDGLVTVLDPDSDDDALFDGTERGKDCDNDDTLVQERHCVPDGDGGATITSAVMPDTDKGGVIDGGEDTDLDGVIDADETDPTAGHAADDGTVRDSDGDGLSDDLEDTLGSNPRDMDSDDDGLLDGDENNPSDDTDRDGRRNINDDDSDGDRVKDGTERGTDCDHPDTRGDVCVPDADGGDETTSAVNPDTDFGGSWDGTEDENLDGEIDPGETDPNDPTDDVGCMKDSDCDGEDSGAICEMGKCEPGCRDVPGSGCPDGMVCSSDSEEPGACTGTIPGGLTVGGRYGGGGFACAVGPGERPLALAGLVMGLASLLWLSRRRRRG